MAFQSSCRNHFQEHRGLFIIIAIGLLIAEIEIFAMAATTSGRASYLHVMDLQGNIVYVTKSSRLYSTEKSYFEKTFGPLANYKVNVVTQNRPFPIRAWLAAAVGVPIALVLLFGFYLKAYEALFVKKDPITGPTFMPHKPSHGSRISWLSRICRMNIFAIGTFVLLGAVGLWALPPLLAEFGHQSVAAIIRHKWLVTGVAMVGLALVAWIIYLQYLAVCKTIDAQAEV